MSGHIPEEIIEEIQNRCDIVEVINSYIPLKKAGGNFKALCPFHNERTPSFIVSPAKQIYHCFGCNAGGNVFGFIMQYEKLDFVSAVKLLADRAGVVIPLEKLSKETDLNGLWEANKFACDLFHKWLYNPNVGKSAYTYLKSRQIKDEIIKKFLLGYAPSGNEFLKEAEKKGFSAELLIKAGLVVKTDRGQADMFRNRLMIPVFNAVGKVAGFSGRVLDTSLPKYLNTPETFLFHKGKLLYGLHVSKSQIMKEEKVIICEGHFDFLRAYQEGLYNIVASQGTAFTIDHVNLLRRYASTIIVSFDGDTAGNKASLSGLGMFLLEGLQVKVVELPKGYDPDLLIKEKGISLFKNLISKAKDILDTRLDRLCGEHSVSTTDGKLKIISELLTDMSNIKNEIQKRQFIKQVAVRLGVPEDSVWLELKRSKKQSGVRVTQSARSGSITENIISKASESPGEKQLVQVLMDNDLFPNEIMDGLIINQMRNPVYKTILDLIIKLKKTNRWKGPGSLLAYIKDENLQRVISQLSVEDISDGLDKEKIIGDCIYDIKRRYKEDKIKNLISQIEDAEKKKLDIKGLVQEVNNLRREVICK